MSAAARAAKVKSDLLMGLNSLSARPGTPKDSSTGALSVGSDGGSPNQMNQMKLNMLNQGSYGSTPYESVRMNGYGSSGTVSGPPPGLGPSNGTISGNGSNNNSPHMMSTMLNRENGHQGLPSYGNSGKPLDVATMMSTLDLFGPGSPASSLMMSPNWSSMTNGSSQQQQQQQQQHQQQQQQQQQQRQEMMNGQGGRSTNEEVNGGSATGSSTPTQTSLSTAHSVEDLELQVINAKMETQMLENQLNAVIKRNRRKLYA
ncbi:MAG: hypothetical protein BYD32DRAFT_402933 [Podila humilis]|nr:MAG: hypothetical protein BYD32DRAFT_402933 [Podila humilis]